jgi:TolA-binding protein
VSGEQPTRWIDRARDPNAEGDDVARAARLIAKVELPSPRPSARQRVFRRLEHTRDIPERRVWAWALSGAIAGALAMFAMMRGSGVIESLDHPSPALAAAAEISTVDGEVEARDPAGAPASARIGRKLRAGDRLRTGAKSTSSLSLGALGGLVIAPSSEVVVVAPGDAARGLEVDLVHGAVVVMANAHPPSPVRIAIVAGEYRVSAGAARLDVSRGDRELEVTVAEGSAELEGPFGARTLVSGARFSANTQGEEAAKAIDAPRASEALAADAPSSASESAPEADAESGEESAGKGDRVRRTLVRATKHARKSKHPGGELPSGEDVAAGSANETSPGADANPEARDRGAEGSEAARLEPADRDAAKTEPLAIEPPRSEAARADSAAREGRAEERSHALSETPEIPGPAPRATDEDAARIYARARSEQNPTRAIALFDEVATRGGSFAEIAQYQAARLTMNAGRCKEAIDRFRALIGRHPDGAYAQESMLDVLECRIKLGALDTAGGDLEAFLLKYPNSERSPELRFLRAELNRRQDRIAEAAKDYEASLGSRRDQDALFFLAWSKARLGERDAARALLGEYLERYPSKIHGAEARKLLEALERAPKK